MIGRSVVAVRSTSLWSAALVAGFICAAVVLGALGSGSSAAPQLLRLDRHCSSLVAPALGGSIGYVRVKARGVTCGRADRVLRSSAANRLMAGWRELRWRLRSGLVRQTWKDGDARIVASIVAFTSGRVRHCQDFTKPVPGGGLVYAALTTRDLSCADARRVLTPPVPPRGWKRFRDRVERFATFRKGPKGIRGVDYIVQEG